MADKKFPRFTSEQQEFIMARLAAEDDYGNIMNDFKLKFPHVVAPFESDIVDKILYDRIKLIRSRKSDELENYIEGDASEPIAPLADAYGQLKFLNDLVLSTPAESVVSEGVDSNGNPFKKNKSNRADIVRMIELMRRIAVDLVTISDDEMKEKLPELVAAGVLGIPMTDKKTSENITLDKGKED